MNLTSRQLRNVFLAALTKLCLRQRSLHEQACLQRVRWHPLVVSVYSMFSAACMATIDIVPANIGFAWLESV